MLEWCRKLLALRKTSPSLNDGDLHHLRVSFDENKRWLEMERGLVKVLINLSDEAVKFANAEGFALVLSSKEDVLAQRDEVLLPPNRLAVLSGE